MHPEPTPGQREMMNAVRRVLEKEVTPERLLGWQNHPGKAAAALGPTITELGWPGFGAPESAGGAGADGTDVALLYEECGRGLLPLSLIHAMRGVQALVDLDPACDLLPRLVRSEASIAIALDEETARDPDHYTTVIEDGRVSGAKAYVINAAAADYHLVAAREGEGLSLGIVKNEGLRIRALRGFADDSQAHVEYEAVPLYARLSPVARGRASFDRMWLQQQLLALAEMVGGMGWVLDESVAYVKEREQFGQVIGLFQAVRHQLADLAISLTACRHLAYQAITRSLSNTVEGTERESALAYVGQAFKRAVWTGHHLHGGAGYVVEHPLHWHGERAQSYCIRYTPEAPPLERIAAALLDPLEDGGRGEGASATHGN